jgi:uncharacterized protein (TIGR02246 family)
MISNLPHFDSKKSLTSYVVWAYHINPEKTIIDLRDRKQMSEPSSSSRSADEDAIRALYQQSVEGWNKGSGEAFAAPFAGDGDLVGFDGTHLKGRQEITSFHQQLFDTFVKGSRLIGKVRSVRSRCGCIARSWRNHYGRAIRHEPERNSVQTLVALKDSR